MDRVLLIEDNTGDIQLIRRMLGGAKGDTFDVECADRLSSGLERLAAGGVDVVLLDLGLPDSRGLDTFSRTYAQAPQLPIIVLTGIADETLAIKAVRKGAQDYLVKGQVDSNLLVRSMRYAIERKRAEEERARHERQLEALWKMARMVDEDRKTLLHHLLGEIIRMTQSLYAFYGFLNEDKGVMPIYSWSRNGIRNCRIEDNPIANSIITAGIWDDMVSEGRVIIINDYQADHPSKYEPADGYVPLTRVLVVPIFSHGRIVALATVANKPSDYMEEDAREVDALATSMQTILERKQAEEELQQSFEKARRTLEGTVQAMAATAERKDPYTAGHQQRVSQLACAIAKEMNLSKEQIEGIHVAGVLHDIGKIYVPAEILNKPGRLNEMEMGLIKTHSQAGPDILKGIEFPWPVAQIVLQHQERMDGSGYPSGLSGEDILLEARILAVADVVEAMASHRPYRPAHGIEKALEEISQQKGVLYDPQVVDACVKIFTEKGFGFG